MASVYRALHLNLDREIAIKVMDPAMSSDESFSERFIREARISARLIHPHIVQIYDVNHFDGMNYIAMEYLAFGDVGDFIHKEMPQNVIYQIMQQMTDALDYASGRGYVHRDIKPGNIMLRAQGDFVLTDFGIARAANSGTQMTQTGLMVGTPSYMSPEQAKGLEVDGRSDLYALAILCFEMLTKTLPFESESAVTTAVKHLTDEIPTLGGRLEAYQGFFNMAMAKAADDRFQSGREMYQAFIEASKEFGNDEVLTGALPIKPEQERALHASGTGQGPSSMLSEVTQVSPWNSSAGSRPYRLAGTEQRERVVSGLHKRKQGLTGGIAGRVIAAVLLAGVLGYFAFDYWQQQQGAFDADMQAISTGIASGYTAIDQENLPAAALAFGKVLAIDSENSAAATGLKKIDELYARAIEQALQQRDDAGAAQLIDEYSANLSGRADTAAYQLRLAQLVQDKRAAAESEAEQLALQQQQAREVAEQAAYVDERLAQAARAMEQLEKDPAMAVQAAGLYRDVVARDSDSEAANSGMAILVAYFLDRADAATAKGDFVLAAEILSAADELLPEQAALLSSREELPALEAVWDKEQAAAQAAQRDSDEAARARQVAAAAQQQAREIADSGIDALRRGDHEAAQQAYDQVSASYAELDFTLKLRGELQVTYERYAQEQIINKDYDSASNYVALGMAVAPNNPAWADLQSQIEISQGSRRRLGAY